ncbi:MAG TPA: hypothetical protein GX395_06690 [Clostridia bacterium]|nr:hypothetical protein [Clostridia bacterium]
MVITGKIRVDKRTKNLVKRIKPQEIAVIDHADLDELSALSLVKAKVKAVVNASPSMTGNYPNTGPLTLLNHGIPLLDNVGPAVMNLKDHQYLEIKHNEIYIDKQKIAGGERQTKEKIKAALEKSKRNLARSLNRFIENTILNADLERSLIIENLSLPPLTTQMKDRHVLIVVRGQGYLEDLAAIKSYINDLKPVLIGVDGGADALRELGYFPHLIMGDMDSVSDEALLGGSELVVHAYANGHAPGLDRIKKLGLEAKIFAAPGTSEDAAMLLAHQAGAALLVAVGTHTSMIDFLEKGRPGMASTVLTRIKVGAILVDAKGVSKLYPGKPDLKAVLKVILAACLPLIIIASTSSLLSHFTRLLWLKVKLLFSF